MHTQMLVEQSPDVTVQQQHINVLESHYWVNKHSCNV